MLFKPTGTKLWDTFILPHNNKYYLFYLQLRHKAWDGYGLAISDDLIHWTDRGTILEADPVGSVIGSGMVYRAGDRWIINFSGEKDGVQQIYFAESDDLLNWRKLSRKIVCVPDPRWYENKMGDNDRMARWDCVWAVPQTDGSFLGFVTAGHKNGPAGANGVAGLVSSRDGIHWTAEPPASEPCGMVWAEVGCYLHFGPCHYLLIGSSSGLGARFDPVYTVSGKSGGMYVMMSSKSIRGPYRLVDGDPLLLGCRNAPPNWAYIPAYFVRVFEQNSQYFLYHHWMSRADFLDGWFGTIKILEENAPGRLSIKYWPGNEKLKGEKIFSLDRPNLHPLPPKPSGDWNFKPGIIKGHTAGSALVVYELPDFYENGVVIEAEVSLRGDGAGGFFFGTAEHDTKHLFEGVACLANRRGLYEFGRVCRGVVNPTFMAENHVLRFVPENKSLRWRLLIRGEFIELYVEDELLQCYGFSAPAVRNIGIFLERAEIEVSRMSVCRFT